ncbi:coiled-coil domain-containing protein 134-like isoform X2 [Ornithodoros turicata]|uniref:coiled-coil domain-containing protein 134-like isoform X2 n=1 Tax=Ornithodoros turicata TaxID=34597 RepID=UPI00313A1D64
MHPSDSLRIICLVCFAGLSKCSNSEGEVETPADVVHYRKVFKLRQVDRLEAVKTILKLNDVEKQSRLVSAVVQKINEVLIKSKLMLERSDYIPGASFPRDEAVRDALSQVLENTAFMGEILLRLPDITHGVLGLDRSSALTIYWAIGFANSTGIYDAKTTKLCHLMAQELGIIEKQADYFNPYSAKHVKSLWLHKQDLFMYRRRRLYRHQQKRRCQKRSLR